MKKSDCVGDNKFIVNDKVGRKNTSEVLYSQPDVKNNGLQAFSFSNKGVEIPVGEKITISHYNHGLIYFTTTPEKVYYSYWEAFKYKVDKIN